MKRILTVSTLLLTGFLTIPFSVFAKGPMEGSHGSMHGSPEKRQSSANVDLLNTILVDQNGKSVQFKTDVIGDHIVVMNFIYTTCTTQCPLNSQILAQVEKELPSRESDGVRLVSLSIEPGTDTPERLKKYSEKIGSGPGWTWLTGHRPEVNELLNALGVYTPDFKTHPSVVLVGDGKSGNWTRFYGTPSSDQILSKVQELISLRHKGALSTVIPQIQRVAYTNVKNDDKDAKARAYFTDLPVITHDGRQLRFYSDLLQNKVVLINLFYGKCENSCPMIHTKLSKLQTDLKDYMGKSVFFISITIDPEPDTPEALAKYVQNFQPGKGWSFVTGNPENIKTITKRLGQAYENKEGHPPFLMIGDVKRARWRKVMPNISDKELTDFLRTLVSDSAS